MSDAPFRFRAWFQSHLSTCEVLMVVAGGAFSTGTRASPGRTSIAYSKPRRWA